MPEPEDREEEETEEEEEEEEEDDPPPSGEADADDLDGTHSDAEVMLRMAIDLVSDLVEKKRVPQTLLDALESAHVELIDAMPDD
jgi:hypothetical protein